MKELNSVRSGVAIHSRWTVKVDLQQCHSGDLQHCKNILKNIKVWSDRQSCPGSTPLSCPGVPPVLPRGIPAPDRTWNRTSDRTGRTLACENITFPILRMRMVKKDIISGILQETDKHIRKSTDGNPATWVHCLLRSNCCLIVCFLFTWFYCCL